MSCVVMYPYKEDPALRKMRVQTWFRAVALASGKTTGELERLFGDDSNAKAMRSGIWNKYKRGEVVPRSGRQGDGRPKLVERVEARYPGTARWLFSPLWRLVDRAPMEMGEIKRIYESMPKSIRAIFVAPENEATPIFWRRSVDTEHACEILLRFGDLDAFVALLTMLKEAEVTQDRYQYGVVMNAITQQLRCFSSQQRSDILVIPDLIRHFNKVWFVNN